MVFPPPIPAPHPGPPGILPAPGTTLIVESNDDVPTPHYPRRNHQPPRNNQPPNWLGTVVHHSEIRDGSGIGHYLTLCYDLCNCMKRFTFELRAYLG